MFFFDAREKELVELVVRAVGDTSDRAVALVRGLEWLGRVAALVVDCPPLTRPDQQQANASVDALSDHLCSVAQEVAELGLPTKAVVGQAYLVAKINFIKALEAALVAVHASGELLARARFEIGQSIYSRLAEEVFIAIITDRGLPRPVKDSAGRFLHRIWEQRLLIEIDDFAPYLEAAWEARNKVRPVLGTMLGSHEVFRLFQEAKDARFMDFFNGDDVPLEQTEAFEEFLFGLAHEEIARLRAHLSERHLSTVSADEAVRVLGNDGVSLSLGDGPEALYTSYRRRKVKAAYRCMTGAHGPKHTAEEYVMLSFLQRSGARDKP
jgi:hypothetical protein